MHTSPPPARSQLVLFSRGPYRLALPLEVVRRIVPAVQVTRVPDSPDVVAGVVNFQGEVIAVLDVGSRLGLAPRDIALADQFLIAQTRERTVALIVDQSHGLASAVDAAPGGGAIRPPWLEAYEGVALLDDGLVLIFDLEKFLSPAESRALDDSMELVR